MPFNNQSVKYYNDNAQEFYDRSVNCDLSDSYGKFLSRIPDGGKILDAGCGSGRDSRYFLDAGYQVDAFDASEQMVSLAAKKINQSVQHMTFQDMQFELMFDGVWACASLLHVPYSEKVMVYQNIWRSLKSGGVFYASYKTGNSEMVIAERIFHNINKELAEEYLINSGFELLEYWEESDKVSQYAISPAKKWSYFLARKLV